MAKSLNKVQLIGNLTRDPELRYTPTGAAVCTIGLATNRQWTTESGEKKDEAEFHRLVAWNKLAEICGQLLKKGRKAYFEGRLQTRTWQAQDGSQKSTTEIVVSDMIILDSRRDGEMATSDFDVPEAALADVQAPSEPATASKKAPKAKKEEVKEPESEDIPF